MGSRAQELQEETCSEQHRGLFICLFLRPFRCDFKRTKQTAADSSATVSSDREREARLAAHDSAELADRTNQLTVSLQSCIRNPLAILAVSAELGKGNTSAPGLV